MNDPIQEFARQLASAYAALAPVRAVALTGSRRGPFGPDALSDIDLYVYRDGEIAPADRRRIASNHSAEVELGNRFWEEGDEWLAQEPAVKVDVMFREVRWIEGEVERVMDRHQAQLGYSTCFLYNVQTGMALYDRDGWLFALKARASQPYPAALRDAILAKNHPVLRKAHSAYLHQIASAAERGDFVGVNHRVAAFLASYFDIVIAVNLLTHPGEKRLVKFVEENCPSKPENFSNETAALLASVPQGEAIVERVTALLDSLDAWLLKLGLLPPWPPTGEKP